MTMHISLIAANADDDGISGNEKADTAAKSALSLRVTPMKIPILFLVLLCWFQKNGSNFGTAAQEINYKLLW